MKNCWDFNAHTIENNGGEVNWDERYYICLKCGEPIYEKDWTNRDMLEFLCPICTWEGD